MALDKSIKQANCDVKISLTQLPCCAVKSCPLMNDRDLLAGFSDFYLPLSHVTPSIPSSYWIHICYGKTRMAGLQSGKGRTMIDSVIWAQYINVTRHRDSHVAIANAAPTHCVRQQQNPDLYSFL